MHDFTIDWYSIGPWMMISAVVFAISAGVHTAWSERQRRVPKHKCCCDPHRSPVTVDADGGVWLGCIMQGCAKRFRWGRDISRTERFQTAWEGKR
jgi:hypothetical protein